MTHGHKSSSQPERQWDSLAGSPRAGRVGVGAVQPGHLGSQHRARRGMARLTIRASIGSLTGGTMTPPTSSPLHMAASTEQYESLIRSAARSLKGHERRLFQAEVTMALCGGNPRAAGWHVAGVARQAQTPARIALDGQSGRQEKTWKKEFLADGSIPTPVSKVNTTIADRSFPHRGKQKADP